MTFRVTVFGDTYDDILEKAEQEILSFIELEDEEDFSKKISYEIQVEKDEAFDAEFSYKAEVIARIK